MSERCECGRKARHTGPHRLGRRICSRCLETLTDLMHRCPACGCVASFRGTEPRRQSLHALMDTVLDAEPVPVDVTPGVPARRRGRWGHGPS